MIRTLRWLAVVAAVLVATSPPTWAIAVTATAAAAMVLARASGSIRRMRNSERHPAGGAVALGTDTGGGRVLLTDRQLSAHALILGATGAGKSTTLLTVLTEHVASGRPVVVIDMKGSPTFARTLADAAASVGRPFRLWTPDGPGRWNPLAHGNATELKDKLIASERFTEPHYQRAAERFVQTVLQVLQHVHPDKPSTLEEVARLMEPRRVAALLRDAPRELAERVQDYIAALSPDQLSAIRGLGTRLALIIESNAGPYLAPAEGQDSIDLRLALTGGRVRQRDLVARALPGVGGERAAGDAGARGPRSRRSRTSRPGTGVDRREDHSPPGRSRLGSHRGPDGWDGDGVGADPPDGGSSAVWGL
jgi:hypothetical protein